ncbi:hypothetical protein EDD11_006289 [Mortierella claussenii]|nr:hypothetical protein EDD11_006289 [Mortierella claussenii]
MSCSSVGVDPVTMQILKPILDRCSVKLQELTFHVSSIQGYNIPNDVQDEARKEVLTKTEDERELLVDLKKMNPAVDKPYLLSNWSRFLKRENMRQTLASNPRLQTFVTLNGGSNPVPEAAHFMPEDFIDLDHASNSLKPWKCESSLRMFRAKILGIPPPDVVVYRYWLSRENGLQEIYFRSKSRATA